MAVKSIRSWIVLASLLIATSVVWYGCSSSDEAPVQSQSPQVLDHSVAQVREVMSVQDRYTGDIMANANVVGTATGLTDDGQLAVLVFLKEEATGPVVGKGAVASGVPATLDNIPVVFHVTGEFKAFKGGGGGVSHTAIQTPPIQMGTSGGWRYDLANGYCCAGTLGSLVRIGSTQYILSNYHVLEADIVNGGNSRVAQAGDPVIQPGMIDISCNANNAQNVATISGIKSLPGSNVDAAIAQVIPGMVRTDGSILEVGTISASTVAASLNQAVKKSGRTTGLTRSTVSGLNATVSVTYENECAGGTAFTKTFTGQIVIANKASRFLAGGDSGSLMVEDVTTNPRAVGLLFAGSTTSAIANPIGQVLSFFGASMVGN